MSSPSPAIAVCVRRIVVARLVHAEAVADPPPRTTDTRQPLPRPPAQSTVRDCGRCVPGPAHDASALAGFAAGEANAIGRMPNGEDTTATYGRSRSSTAGLTTLIGAPAA